MYEELTAQARQAVTELLEAAKLKPGKIFVVGCSSSEMVGARIGKGSSMEAAQAVFDGIYPVLHERGIYLAAQCCEHLNRALILEQEAADKLTLRREREKKRYYDFYGVDITDMDNYDLVVDTTDKTPEEVAEAIAQAYLKK